MNDDFTIEMIDGKSVLTAYHGSEQTIVLPNGIHIIGEGVFQDNKSIDAVILPNSTEVIEKCAFCRSSIKKISFPPSIKKIKELAFYYCSKLESVTFSEEGVEEIGSSAFSFTALTQIIIPNSIRTIPYSCFSRIKTLMSVTFPNNLLDIGEIAFAYDDQLKIIKLPASLETIQKKAFFECDNLSNVIFEGRPTKISSTIFKGCSKLKEITSPNMEKYSIDTNAFKIPFKSKKSNRTESSAKEDYYTMAIEGDYDYARRELTRFNERLAIHEAGHAIIALFDSPARKVNHITLCDENHLGATSIEYAGELLDQIHQKLCNLFGGRNAEVELLGDADLGCENDMKQVFELLDACGIYAAEKIDWLLEANNKAKDILNKHHDEIRILADALIRKGSLSSSEIDALING